MNKKINYINNLCVEVTRKCNMKCAHCLRGPAQTLNLSEEVVDRFVDGLASDAVIGSIAFTGGEPSLNVPIIKYIREVFESKGVPVGSFYVVTNGKKNPLSLMEECLRWYAFVDDKDLDYNGLALSSDRFHDTILDDHLNLLRGLAFFREDDKKMDPNYPMTLLDEGRARNLASLYTLRPVRDWGLDITEGETGLTVDEGKFYLNVKGDIVSGCDWSYESQNKRTLTSVFTDNWVEKLAQAVSEKSKDAA